MVISSNNVACGACALSPREISKFPDKKTIKFSFNLFSMANNVPRMEMGYFVIDGSKTNCKNS
jgi:hypothetical protein